MVKRPGWWLRIAETTLICLLVLLLGCIPRSVETFIAETPATALFTKRPMVTLLPPFASPSVVAPTSLPTMALTMMPSLATVQPARAYFVAPTGNDANPGTIDQPWKTIQKAADTLTAGSIVYIRSGIYHERIEEPARGNFRLRRGSLAVDAGSAISAPNVDFEGNARPVDGDGDGNALFDIGADELSLW